MIHPKFWLKHAQARRALRGYPLYDVPHKQAEGTLSEKEAQENFDYFMRVRLERLAFFQEWLKKNFGVNATLDGDGVRAVSKWVDDYGGGLIGDRSQKLRADTNPASIFAKYQPNWEGEYAGYNVMFDLGIFIGEYLIAKRPRLHWEIYRGHAQEPETYESAHFMRPHLGGMPRGFLGDALPCGLLIASARKHAHVRFDGPPPEKDGLIQQTKHLLYCSKLPDGDGLLIFGDSSNEPL